MIDLATFLVGRWRVTREVVGLRSSPSGMFTGEAVFAADGQAADLVHYEEHGTIQLDRYRGAAQRHLRYEVEGARAMVRFADGRFFHDLDLTTGTWTACHPCGADLHTGTFVLHDHDAWQQRWRVRGPDGDYDLITLLERQTCRERCVAATG